MGPFSDTRNSAHKVQIEEDHFGGGGGGGGGAEDVCLYVCNHEDFYELLYL